MTTADQNGSAPEGRDEQAAGHQAEASHGETNGIQMTESASMATDSSPEAAEETSESADGEGPEHEEAEAGADAGAGPETGGPAEGAKRKRRRRRRKKGDSSASGDVPAGETAGGAAQAGSSPGGHHAHRKEPHLPFQRFFENRDRGERRHAFAVGEIVAGRVLRLENGTSAIDLFGKATAFALANESREVPIPTAAHVEEPEEHEEVSPGPDPSQVGAAAADLEGAVGMPASESLPPHAELSAEAREKAGWSPGPDGVFGTGDDAPPSGESDPNLVARAARGLREVGTPVSEDRDSEVPPAPTASGTTTVGGIEAPDEAPAAEAAPEQPLLEIGAIFRGRVAAVAESGHVGIHNRLVTRSEARAKLGAAREAHQRVFGIVFGFNRGGFDVLVEGVRAFCPVSGMTLDMVEDPETLLGRRLEFSVQQAKSGNQGIVVTRRSMLEKEARKRAKELRKSLQPGQTIKGRVTQVRDFGVFVDIGGLEGLVHMSELSWDRNVRPGDVAKPGDEVQVQVLRVTEPQSRKDRDGRIALSLKALAPDPWEEQLDGAVEGSARKGKVSRTAEFGAFVEIAPGIDGLLHISELGRDLKHASERIKEGEEVYVVLERIDRKARRISLSKMSDQDVKLFQEGTLETTPGGKAIRPGALLKVKVERVEVSGLHVQVEGVIGRRGRGFIPNVEMGTDRGTDHRKKFPPGTELDVKVIGQDRDGGLRLSRKAFATDEERRAVHDYRKEAATKGFGTFGDILKNKLSKSLGQKS